jgi:very-short-patch-repair endonuclease
VVSLTQLKAVGVSETAARDRVSAGRLHRIHRGVYAVGHRRLTFQGRWMAAVLAYGPRALLSHRSAAELWGLVQSGGGVLHVTVPGRSARSRPGVRAHRATLRPEDAMTREGIPCTSPARTLLDFAVTATKRELERAAAEARVLRLPRLQPFDAPGHAGVPKLRAAMGEEPKLTKSELEERFLRLCDEHSLPGPAVNAPVLVYGGHVTVDFLWPAEKLVIETDGYAFHSHRGAFERDRRRDQLLAREGFEVLRFTWHQLVEEPAVVAATCTSVLRRCRPQQPSSVRASASATSPRRRPPST